MKLLHRPPKIKTAGEVLPAAFVQYSHYNYTTFAVLNSIE